MIEPKGLAKENFAQTVPALRETAAAVSEAISYGLDRYGERDVEFAFDAIPFCLISEYIPFYDDLYTNGILSMSEADEKGLVPVDCRNRDWANRCLSCSLHGFCLGAYKEYLSRAGDHELLPITEQRSNQFLMRSTGEMFARPQKGCAAEAIRACDPLSIMVDAGRKGAVIYRADTKDFSTPQVMETLGKAQVFAGKGGKIVPMKPDDRCLKCGSCHGIYKPAKPDDSNMAVIEKAISSIRGRVMDVGCGDVVLWKHLGPLVNSGKIEYHALDPDPAKIDQLTRKSRHVCAHITRVEDFVSDPDSFDYCLMLGSLNHILDLPAALAKVFGMLKPGGRLIASDDMQTALMVEDLPCFGDGFEHYRNLGLEPAARLLCECGFEIQKELDVGCKTGPRWAIMALKPGT
jgi:hypothetical protein